jgi:hypothetical protein
MNKKQTTCYWLVVYDVIHFILQSIRAVVILQQIRLAITATIGPNSFPMLIDLCLPSFYAVISHATNARREYQLSQTIIS